MLVFRTRLTAGVGHMEQVPVGASEHHRGLLYDLLDPFSRLSIISCGEWHLISPSSSVQVILNVITVIHPSVLVPHSLHMKRDIGVV